MNSKNRWVWEEMDYWLGQSSFILIKVWGMNTDTDIELFTPQLRKYMCLRFTASLHRFFFFAPNTKKRLHISQELNFWTHEVVFFNLKHTVQKSLQYLKLNLVRAKIEVYRGPNKHTNTEGKCSVHPKPVTVSALTVMEVMSQLSSSKLPLLPLFLLFHFVSSPPLLLLFVIIDFDRTMPGFSHHTYESWHQAVLPPVYNSLWHWQPFRMLVSNTGQDM